jgi:hypothetical protein
MRHIAIAALLALALPAAAREYQGVKLPDTMAVGGKTLDLNGAGLRKKFVVKVYVGALYLAEKSKDAKAVIAADQPKAVRMTFLRDLTKDQVMDAFKEGFEKNSAKQANALMPKLAEAGKALPARLKEGSTMIVTYVPGKGSTLGMEGDAMATIEGKDFADALFRNWLGDAPADENLRDGMLGR